MCAHLDLKLLRRLGGRRPRGRLVAHGGGAESSPRLARSPARSLLRPARGAGGACSRPTPQAQTRYDRVWAAPSSASRTEPSGLSVRWRRARPGRPARPPLTGDRRATNQQAAG
jgi:hypothetical protein